MHSDNSPHNSEDYEPLQFIADAKHDYDLSGIEAPCTNLGFSTPSSIVETSVSPHPQEIQIKEVEMDQGFNQSSISN